MTPQGAEVLAGVSAAFAAIGLYGFFSRLRRDRAVADTPVMRVRSAAQGYVKVLGRAQPASGNPTGAPLSGRPCVWWDFRIDEQQGIDNRGRPNWVNIEHATSVEPFVLADDDAQCLVGPVHADVTPSASHIWSGPSPRPDGLPPPGINTAHHMGPYRYREEILEVGAHLCVVGEFRSRSQTGDVSAAIAAAKDCEAQNLGSRIDRVSMISQPSDGRPFMIAPLTPEQLERRESHHAWGYFAFGFVWVVVCAWALSLALS